MALTASSRGAYGEESPEALRRRADVLLDEMMLGGIDTGAAGPQNSGVAAGSGNGNGAAHWPSADEMALDYDGASHASGPNGTYGGDLPVGGESVLPPPSTSSRLISAEERYAHLAGERPGSEPPKAQTQAAPLSSSSLSASRMEPANGLSPTNGPGAETSVAYAGDFQSDYTSNSLGLAGNASGQTAGSAVRRQSPSLASQMAVGVRAANRSNLLPRNNEIDADTS
jgi:hypothetical protein